MFQALAALPFQPQEELYSLCCSCLSLQLTSLSNDKSWFLSMCINILMTYMNLAAYPHTPQPCLTCSVTPMDPNTQLFPSSLNLLLLVQQHRAAPSHPNTALNKPFTTQHTFVTKNCYSGCLQSSHTPARALSQRETTVFGDKACPEPQDKAQASCMVQQEEKGCTVCKESQLLLL